MKLKKKITVRFKASDKDSLFLLLETQKGSEAMADQRGYVHPGPQLITITMTKGQWREIHEEASGHLSYWDRESEAVNELERILNEAKASGE